MQPSARQQELERLYNARRGHVPHISISDDNYHVTEALGSYYGDEGPPSPSSPTASNDRRDNRPLSFLPTAAESFENSTADGSAARKSRRNGSYFDMSKRAPLGRTQSNERLPAAAAEDGAERNSLKRSGSRASEYSTGNGGGGAAAAGGGGLAPAGESHTPPSTPPLNRSPSTDTAIQQFPLNDIDYESSPAAVAQELSNLQAIRRMSMNVDAADPDLPSFNAGGLVPTVAPKSSEDEDDAARLFWVPARLHPELAPKEFKTFIEDRVDKIRRRSGDAEALSPESPERSASDSSLRRKKSMLSHQIDTKGNYEDGAERLERKRSKGMSLEGQTRVDLSELETLVSDPTQLMRRMSLDTSRRSLDSGVEMTEGEDMPILPPVGQSLKRSTRTTYRKGSLKKGERMPYAKRVQQRQTEPDAEETSPRRTSFSAAEDSEPILGLTRVNTEPSLPAPPPSASREEFPPRQSSISQRRGDAESPRSSDDLSQSRPSQDRPPSQDDRFQQRSPPASQDEDRQAAPPPAAIAAAGPPRPQHRQFQSRLASGPGRTTAQLPGYNNTNPLPHIIETLPDGTKVPAGSLISQIAERRASLDGPERKRSGELGRPFHQRGGAHMRPVPQQTNRGELPRSSTLDDLSSHPMLLPGSGGIGTDSLTLVPTYDEKKYEKKESSSSSSSSRKSTWKWVFGGDNDEEKRAAREEKAGSGSDSSSGIRSSLKSSRSNRQQQAQQQQQLQLQQQQQQLQQQQQQPTEKARLDVLQNSIDGNVPPRGRESLVLNREDIKLDDDQQQQQQQQRKKDPKRSSESKKDKDSGLLSAIFGVKKKSSSDSDVSKDKRRASRIDRGGGGRDGGAPVSPEPVLRILKPDIDYNWTRFSILEERAIYRMAHIKLANPRRALYSQVLLSNFMYSYLAKVQMMHPQVQIPAAHQRNHQRGQQKQDEQQQQQQPAEFSQYQRWQQQQEREEAAAAASSSSGSNATAPPNAGLQQHSSSPSSSAFDASAAAAAEYDHDDFSSPTALGYELSRSNSEAYDHESLSSSSSLSNQQQQQQQQQQQNYPSTSPSSSPTKTSFGLGGGGGDGTAASAAAAYSVAGTHDYLGYPKESQPFDSSSPPSSSQRGLWEDEDGVEETEASLW